MTTQSTMCADQIIRQLVSPDHRAILPSTGRFRQAGLGC
jgi:hypothetical protein